MAGNDLKQEIDKALSEIETLRNRITELEKSATGLRKLPDTMLLSESFMTRAFAVFGHNFVVGMMIAVPIWLMLLVIAVFMGVFS